MNVSKEKLLEATLLSLETLGRQGKIGVDGSGLNDYSSSSSAAAAASCGVTRGSSGGSLASTDHPHHPQQQQGATGGSIASSSSSSSYTSPPSGPHPTESYLRGALWLGRNLTMAIEEMAEGMDHFRVKQLAEISTATIDPDMSRALHRLSLLAASGNALTDRPITDPLITNRRITNPLITNRRITNRRITNRRITNCRITNYYYS